MTDFHTVKQGDTLTKIARQHGSSVSELRKLNDLPDANKLRIGQKIALNKHVVLGFEALFLDADRNPVKNIEYLFEFNGKQISGATGANGKSKKIMTASPTDKIRILVKRFDGTLKEIGQVISGYGNKLATLISPLIVIDSRLEPHPGKTGEPLHPEEPIKPAYHLTKGAKPASQKKEPGLLTTQTSTAKGKPLTLVKGDIADLDFLDANPMLASLTEADFISAAKDLKVSQFHIKAIIEVEAAGRFFWTIKDSGRKVPPILFERHKFSKNTARKFDDKYPDISARKTGGYVGHLAEYKRLVKAAQLDREAALKSASWGAFQIMGEHHSALGFSTAEEFVKFYSHSEKSQLQIFVKACEVVQKVWGKALRDEDWGKFAKSYNGPDYKKNRYDEKLEAAYKRLKQEVDR